MSTFPGLRSQAKSAVNEPTIREIRSLDEGQLLQWIQQKLPKPLKAKDVEMFLMAEIDGNVFLRHAGDLDFFMKAGLTLGVSDYLAELANIGRKSKYTHLYHGRHADSQLTM